VLHLKICRLYSGVTAWNRAEGWTYIFYVAPFSVSCTYLQQSTRLSRAVKDWKVLGQKTYHFLPVGSRSFLTSYVLELWGIRLRAF